MKNYLDNEDYTALDAAAAKCEKDVAETMAKYERKVKRINEELDNMKKSNGDNGWN